MITESPVRFTFKFLGCQDHTHFCQICGLPGARVAIYRSEPAEPGIDKLSFVEGMTRVDVCVLHSLHFPTAFSTLRKRFQQHVLADLWLRQAVENGYVPEVDRLPTVRTPLAPLFIELAHKATDKVATINALRAMAARESIIEQVPVRHAWLAKWAKQLAHAWHDFVRRNIVDTVEGGQ